MDVAPSLWFWIPCAGEGSNEGMCGAEGWCPTACKVKALYLSCEDSEGNSVDEEEDGKMLALLGEKVAWGGPAGRWS